MSHKTYNTPHRSRVVKTRLTEEEYSDFEERCTTLQINQTEYIQWYRNLEGNMKNTNVLLSIGLSLTKLGEKIQVYIKYLMSDSEIDLKFEKERYHVNVARVSVFPQYYATV